jgi:transposase
VVCVDEMGPLATIPRGGRGWGKKPARRSDRYHKSQTIQLLAAFAPHTGQGIGLPDACKTGETVLDFLQNHVLPRYSAQGKIYLIWDNFSAHKKALNLWQPKPSNVEFAWTPTNASSLNLIEPWFLVLEKTALHNTDLKTTSEIAEHLLDGIDYLNEHPQP